MVSPGLFPASLERIGSFTRPRESCDMPAIHPLLVFSGILIEQLHHRQSPVCKRNHGPNEGLPTPKRWKRLILPGSGERGWVPQVKVV